MDLPPLSETDERQPLALMEFPEMDSIHRLSLLLVLLLWASFAAAQKHVIDESKPVSFLYVVNSPDVAVDDNTLTFASVASVIYFSDRPARIAGHMSPRAFVEQWAHSSFTTDPPNAVLSRSGDGGNSVIVLTSVKEERDGIAFTYRFLEGDALPADRGPAVLFMDNKIIGIDIP